MNMVILKGYKFRLNFLHGRKSTLFWLKHLLRLSSRRSEPCSTLSMRRSIRATRNGSLYSKREVIELRHQFSYKQHWRGGILVLVTSQYTSQQCSKRKHIDADTNAAKNILRAGLSRLACPERGAAHIGHGETVLSDRSLQQEIRSRLVA